MVLTILIAFISLITLIVLHELGHFILAKKFGVKVEEFGIGYPPRLFGKKFGETLYSLNLLPFGAFVKIVGETERIDDPRAFSQKPIWQRALIIIGGVVTFWIVAALLLSIVMALGVATVIEDSANHNLVNPKVQIVAVAPNSPAAITGVKPGDTITRLTISPEGEPSAPYGAGNQQSTIDKVKEVQDFTERYKGEEITLTIQRGKEVFDVSLVPRVSPPEGEGPMGIALVRTAIKSYPWYQAPIQGIIATGNLTVAVLQGWGQALVRAIKRVPTGVQLMGPVGIFSLFMQVSQLGVSYFLQFVATIAVYIALFNILPIPMVDGGKLLFLGIEKVRGRPINQKIEENINTIFFALLIGLMIWITIKDITRIF